MGAKNSKNKPTDEAKLGQLKAIPYDAIVGKYPELPAANRYPNGKLHIAMSEVYDQYDRHTQNTIDLIDNSEIVRFMPDILKLTARRPKSHIDYQTKALAFFKEDAVVISVDLNGFGRKSSKKILYNLASKLYYMVGTNITFDKTSTLEDEVFVAVKQSDGLTLNRLVSKLADMHIDNVKMPELPSDAQVNQLDQIRKYFHGGNIEY